MAFRAILSNGREPRALARGGPNNVFDSKNRISSERREKILILLYRTEGLQPPIHEQAALALLSIESELLDLTDFSEFVQYFCDEYRAPVR